MKPSFKAGMALLFAMLLSLTTYAQAKRPMTFDDLTAIKRIGDAQISPDGSRIAYAVTDVDKNLNRGKRSVWVVPASGGSPQRLITSDKNDFSPRWSADGKLIAFLSTREGAPQIFVADAANPGASNPRKVTSAPEGVGEFIWSPDGKMFAFTTDVYPDCASFNCVAKHSEAEEKSKVKAVIADRLLFRHWDSFKRGKRSHLFVTSIEGADPKDLTPGDHDAPPFSLGDPTAFDFSPDGKEIVFSRNTDKSEATSTNNDLFIVSVNGGEAKRITGNNPGSDTTPRYSPDGKYIAYRSQTRNGCESDRFRLMLYDRKAGTSKELSTGFDRWVGEFVWAPDSQNVFIVAEDRGRELIGLASINGGVKPLIANTASSGITISSDGKTLAFTRSSLAAPAEVFAANSDGSGARQLTQANANLLTQLDLDKGEDFEYDGALDSKIHGFIVKPPQFDKTKKYPMVLLIHGGPQGAWLDSWGYRWNPQMWAARGYVTVLINPHGSTGYGQAFTEQISGEWGGAVYEDLMKGVDHVIKLGYVDPNRLGAAGGSYGGYMVNWILGHSDRFKALVSHAGVYNLTSMYATEELWFTDWEFKGTPWDNPELYTKWSPHLSAKNFKTPTLVVHGELDYRVPVGEGLQLFSTLQRKGVPSKLLYYPDEGHWILKPQNSELWYKTVIDWFDQWLKPTASTASR
ncbi:MAG TPA: S9 family peptidase [Blastocatellia bacterium]|jgi:dipeptidyl aminopeptidase/acylaminoacyl peptidase|nr:S9 family peptidase [Blastocatellia bacterium]